MVPDDPRLRNWLASYQGQTGVTQKTVASRLGVPQPYLSMFIHDKYPREGDRLSRLRQTIADFLLASGVEEPSSDSSIEPPATDLSQLARLVEVAEGPLGALGRKAKKRERRIDGALTSPKRRAKVEKTAEKTTAESMGEAEVHEVQPEVAPSENDRCSVCGAWLQRIEGEAVCEPVVSCWGGCGLLAHADCAQRELCTNKKQAAEAQWACDLARSAFTSRADTPPRRGRGNQAAAASKRCARAQETSADQPACWSCSRCSRLVGKAVFARADDGYFYRGIAVARDPHGQMRVRFDEADASSGGAGTPIEPQWISERHVGLAEVAASRTELRAGLKLLCVWLDGHAYSCELLGGAAHGRLSVQFDDGLQFNAEEHMLRLMLEAPLFVQPLASPMASLHGRPKRKLSQPVLHEARPPEGAQRGPLQRVLGCAGSVWRGVAQLKAGSGACRVERNVHGVPGLHVCYDFLSEAEVCWLRRFFTAHHSWALYNWGSIGKGGGVGRDGDLASVLERIDFGPREMSAEGVAAARSHTQPMGECRQRVVDLLVARLRNAFGEAQLWAEGEEGSEGSSSPNMMQLTRIPPGRCLGNHFDRRDKWAEGIASVAWGEAAVPGDARGEPWTLCMQQGVNKGKELRTVEVVLPPGSAYVLTAQAQGRTGWCQRRAVAHEACSCCWTHGIWNKDAKTVRQSITLRVYREDWGREARGED